MKIATATIMMASLSLAGCTQPTNQSFSGPTGQKVNKTKCSRSPEGCFQTASALCKGPYSVVDSESHAGGLVADILPGPVTWYGMSYICGPSNGVYPKFPFRGPTYQAPVYKPPTRTSCIRNGPFLNCTTS